MLIWTDTPASDVDCFLRDRGSARHKSTSSWQSPVTRTNSLAFVYCLKMWQYCSMQSGANQRRGICQICRQGCAELITSIGAPGIRRLWMNSLQQCPTVSREPLNNGRLTIRILSNNRSPRATLGCKLRAVLPIDIDRSIGKYLSTSTTANIKKAVRENGLHYLGICAGAFLASYPGSSGYNDIDLLDGIWFDMFENAPCDPAAELLSRPSGR